MEEILQALYDSEINAAIWWNWDGGVEVRLGNGTYGDDGNWESRSTTKTIVEAIEWLRDEAFALYPDSKFTREYVEQTDKDTKQEPHEDTATLHHEIASLRGDMAYAIGYCKGLGRPSGYLEKRYPDIAAPSQTDTKQPNDEPDAKQNDKEDILTKCICCDKPALSSAAVCEFHLTHGSGDKETSDD